MSFNLQCIVRMISYGRRCGLASSCTPAVYCPSIRTFACTLHVRSATRKIHCGQLRRTPVFFQYTDWWHCTVSYRASHEARTPSLCRSSGRRRRGDADDGLWVAIIIRCCRLLKEMLISCLVYLVVKPTTPKLLEASAVAANGPMQPVPAGTNARKPLAAVAQPQNVAPDDEDDYTFDLDLNPGWFAQIPPWGRSLCIRWWHQNYESSNLVSCWNPTAFYSALV